MVTADVLCLAGNVEVLFLVLILFYPRQVVNFGQFNFMYVKLYYLCLMCSTGANERTGLCYIKQYKYDNDIT